ncbi:glycosyltransferase family 4 protein [bacterium]|nr:glycosyltransferase family 4 protein [bacterium]
MNILFLTIGSQRTPSTRFRVKQYLPLFEKSGAAVRHVPIPHATLKRIGLFPHLRWADVIFLQKKLFSRLELGILSSFDCPIIYDLDDVVFHEHPLYAGTRHGRKVITKNQVRFRAVLGAATTIIAGNTSLAEDIARYGYKAFIIPTAVDTDRYAPIACSDSTPVSTRHPIIGWIGTRRNLYYLESIKGALARVIERHPQTRLRIICDNDKPLPDLPAEMVRWREETELDELRRFTIGIMPLTDDQYSRGKCGFKLLQYMSLGLPTVSSPIGVNRDIIEPGLDGLLASTEEEWSQGLNRLLENGEQAVRMGLLARQKVVERYSVRNLFPILDRIIKDTVEQARKGQKQ